MPGSWGPGWLADVFDVKVAFDNNPPLLSDAGAGGEGEVFTDPWYAYNGSMHLFCGGDTVISGTITLATSKQRTVQHLGIKVTVEEYIHFMDPYVPTRLKYVSDSISQEDLVNGEAIYPFSIPLSTLSKAPAQTVPATVRGKSQSGEYPNITHWLNSYNGNSFAIRHMLTVEVYRPWYTFNLYRYHNLSFQVMDEASNQNYINYQPREDDKGDKKEVKEDVEDVTDFSPAHAGSSGGVDPHVRIVPETFHVDGLSNRGKCRVNLHSTHINLARSPQGYSRGGAAGDGAIIRGTLQLSDLDETIVSAKCMLLRAEYVGAKTTHDALECEHLLFGVEEIDSVEILEDEEDRQLRVPRSRGYIYRQDERDDVVDTPRVTDPVRRGTTIQFEICLDGSGRDNDMNSSSFSSTANEGTDSSGVTHHMRIQNALWQSLAYQLYPTFYYLPLDLSKETDSDSESDEVNSSPSMTSSTGAAIDKTEVPKHESEVPHLALMKSSASSSSSSSASSSSSSSLSSPSEQCSNTSEAEIYNVTSDESVCLRYFLRVVVVEKSGKKLWETVELVFYYSAHREEQQLLLKNAFLSAARKDRTHHETHVPPYLQTVETDELTEKNENV